MKRSDLIQWNCRGVDNKRLELQILARMCITLVFALQEIKMLIVVTEAQSYKIGGNYVNSLKISNVFLVLYGIIQFKDISSFRMKLSLTVSNIEEKTE